MAGQQPGRDAKVLPVANPACGSETRQTHPTKVSPEIYARPDVTGWAFLLGSCGVVNRSHDDNATKTDTIQPPKARWPQPSPLEQQWDMVVSWHGTPPG